MGKPPRAAGAKCSLELVFVVDFLKRQMLGLQALRKKVTEAEAANARRHRQRKARNRLIGRRRDF